MSISSLSDLSTNAMSDEAENDRIDDAVRDTSTAPLVAGSPPPPLLEPTRTLTWRALVVMIFYWTCGGPFGVESSVATAGPLIACLAVIIIYFVWSVPQAIVAAELSCLFPTNGGPVVWVDEAFHAYPVVGWTNAWCYNLNTASGNAALVVLFASYLPLSDLQWAMWLAMIAFVALVCVLNIVSVKWVSDLGEILAIPVMTPFVAMFVGIGVKGWFTAERWRVLSEVNDMNAADWATLIGVLIWAVGGTDSLGTLAGEVIGGRKAFVRAIIVSSPLVVLSYVLPIVFSVVAFPHWRLWDDTAFIVAAQHIGPWLYYWMLVAAAVSCLGQYQSLVASGARGFWASAQSDARPQIFPSIFSKSYRGRSGEESPWAAIVLLSVVTLVFAALPFAQVVAVATLLRLFNLLLEYLSFLILRFKWPHVERPFAAPGGMIGAFVWVLPSVALAVFYGQTVRDLLVWIITGACVGMILLLYIMVRLIEWCRERPAFTKETQIQAVN